LLLKEREFLFDWALLDTSSQFLEKCMKAWFCIIPSQA